MGHVLKHTPGHWRSDVRSHEHLVGGGPNRGVSPMMVADWECGLPPNSGELTIARAPVSLSLRKRSRSRNSRSTRHHGGGGGGGGGSGRSSSSHNSGYKCSSCAAAAIAVAVAAW